MKEEQNYMTTRKELEKMPYDRNGAHATGLEVCLGDPTNPADWWDEYEREDGTIEYYR